MIYCRHRRHFWHATLRLHSAIHRHHPPQRAVQSQICCFGERKVVVSQTQLGSAQPRHGCLLQSAGGEANIYHGLGLLLSSIDMAYGPTWQSRPTGSVKPCPLLESSIDAKNDCRYCVRHDNIVLWTYWQTDMWVIICNSQFYDWHTVH